MSNDIINTTTATPPFTALDAEKLAGAGPTGQDIFRERVQITGDAVLAAIAAVINTVIAGTEYALVTRPIPPVVGTHANAWNAAAVAANGVSASIDCQFVSNITIFGNANGSTTLTIQFSQDNVNFYDGSSTVVAASSDFSVSGTFGARYIRLKSSQARTITATVAGKD